jgi:hypothetical protein
MSHENGYKHPDALVPQRTPFHRNGLEVSCLLHLMTIPNNCGRREQFLHPESSMAYHGT